MNDMHSTDDSELWENGDLGASEEFVKKVSDEKEKSVDDKLGLQVISIRLQKELITTLKEIAKTEGLGYQPYIRQILTKHVNSKAREKSSVDVDAFNNVIF